MPRNDQIAVHSNGHLDQRYDASLASTASAASPWLAYDFTPEVLRGIMTYEKSIPPSASSHLVESAAPGIPSDSHPTTTFIDAPQVTVRRAIKGMPRRKLPNVPAATLSERTRSWNRAPSASPGISRSIGDAAPSKDQANSSGESKDAASATVRSCDDPFRTHSLASQSLAQYFQRLKVSARDQPQALPAPQHSVSSPQQNAPRFNGSSSLNSTTRFRFPPLPDRLTDEGFSRRERAAQFILLCSQQAGAEELSLCKRLSLPLRRDVSGIFQSKGREKPGEEAKAAAKHSSEERGGSSVNDNESIHSRDHAHEASDDDGEHVDVEDALSAHFGNNKKKRKSSRFASPGPHSTDNPDESSQVHTLDPSLSAASASYVVVPAESNARGLRDRALSDKTNNTFHQAERPATLQVASKPEGGPFALPKSAAIQQQPMWRPPPRQTIGDKHRVAIRQRMRIRLAPVLQQRRVDRAHEHARVEQERQARILASDDQGKPEAETQGDTTPEKKSPPKRTSKAGKRAQAIRGGNSSARPLTIAEIRARAGASTTAPAPTSSGPSPKSKAAPVANGRVASDSAKRGPSPSPSADSISATPTPISAAKSHEMTRTSSQASDDRSSKTKALPQSNFAAPTSSFDFHMTCNVTTRLREVRSSLDKATREMSDLAAESGGERGVLRALGETMYPPRSQKASSKAVEGARDDCLENARPQLNGDWRSHRGEDQQQVADSKIDKRNVSPSATSSRPRGNASTPTQQVRRPSSPAVSKAVPVFASTGKTHVPNGRHTTTRTPSAPSHKHGGACKHGHTQGTGSALFTDDDWICLFCEYELYYGAPPRMLRACKNRKKLVAKKAQVKSKAQAALQGKSSAKSNGCTCHHDHDDRAHNHCHHDHGSGSGSEGCHYHCDHHHDGYVPEKGRRGLHRETPRSRDRHHGETREAPRDRCDCGNSIHSSDFSDDDDKSHTSL